MTALLAGGSPKRYNTDKQLFSGQLAKIPGGLVRVTDSFEENGITVWNSEWVAQTDAALGQTIADQVNQTMAADMRAGLTQQAVNSLSSMVGDLPAPGALASSLPETTGGFFEDTFLNAKTFRDASQLYQDLKGETRLGWKIAGYGVLAVGVTAGAIDAASNFTGVKGLVKGGRGLVKRGFGKAIKVLSRDAPRVIPNPRTGVGYGVNDPPVRIQGSWTETDFQDALRGRPPASLGRPDLHHAGQMPGSGIHEITPRLHQGNKALHPNKLNQGVTKEMRRQDRQLHWWYRAREEGADRLFPDDIYD